MPMHTFEDIIFEGPILDLNATRPP